MRVINVDIEMLEKSSRCFGDDICGRPMVMFHGTSNVYESSIDKNGFALKSNGPLDLDSILHILDLYRRLCWNGEHLGGFAVLKMYSSRDYQKCKVYQRPLFFGESSYRGLLYTSQDFAGGEAIRAAFYALNDLEKFIAQKQMQESHFEDLKRDVEEFENQGAHPSFIEQFKPDIDMKELQENVIALRALKEKICQLRERHQYGIVYAVDLALEPNVLPYLTIKGGEGIEASCPISKRTIIAKCMVPKSFSFNKLQQDPDSSTFLLKKDGLYQAIQANNALSK